jgi:hypothetical protein
VGRGPFAGEAKGRAAMTVMICATEDSKGRIKSRIRAAGANLDKAFFVEAPEVRAAG